MARPRVMIEAPPVTPLPFGLFSAATVVDDASPHWQLGYHYETDHCGPAQNWLSPVCPPASPDFTVQVAVWDSSGEGTAFSIQVDATSVVPSGSFLRITAPSVLATQAFGEDLPVGADLPGVGPWPLRLELLSPEAPFNVVAVADLGMFEAPGVDETETFAADLIGLPSPREPKTVEDGLAGLVEGDPFAVYHLLECRMPGGGVEAGAERARAALRLGEQRAVEQAMYAALTDPAGETFDLSSYWGIPDLHPVDALGLLERYAGANYGGVPTIHTPRHVGTTLTTTGAVIRSGVRLETVQGSAVASYAGALGEVVSYQPETRVKMIVTGQVMVRRSPNIEVGPVPNTRTNAFRALAERVYGVTWECVAASVNVDPRFFRPGEAGPL